MVQTVATGNKFGMSVNKIVALVALVRVADSVVRNHEFVDQETDQIDGKIHLLWVLRAVPAQCLPDADSHSHSSLLSTAEGCDRILKSSAGNFESFAGRKQKEDSQFVAVLGVYLCA